MAVAEVAIAADAEVVVALVAVEAVVVDSVEAIAVVAAPVVPLGEEEVASVAHPTLVALCCEISDD